MPLRDWLSPLLGIAGGVAGSFLPGIGTTLGALGGSALGGLASTAFGERRQAPVRSMIGQGPMQGIAAQRIPDVGTLMRTPRFTPEQQTALSQLLSRGLSGLEALPSAEFGPIRRAAETQFQQQIIPGIAERFTAPGAQRSSAFEQALGGAGAGLAERLAALEQQFNLQRRGQQSALLLSLLQAGLAPQFETGLIPAAGSPWGGLASGLGQAAGSLAPLLAMKYLG